MKRKFNHSLEGLRGLCAITVAVAHVLLELIVLSNVNKTLSYLHFAHTAVLIFFVLSGYVIGINYGNETFDKKEYLLKRMLRIYPIYIIAVLLSSLFEDQVSINKVLTASLFLQGWGDSLTANVVLWSINYEVLFYILFLFVNNKIKALILSIIACIFLAFIIYRTNFVPPIIGGYLAGFSFWLTGLLIAKNNRVEGTRRKSLLFLLFIALSFEHISPGVVILNFLDMKNQVRDFVSIVDVFTMPLCVLIITEAGDIFINPKLRKFLYAYCLLLPSLILFGLFMKNRLFEDSRWIICLTFLTLAYISLFLRSNDQILEKLSFWGSISYAVYIIHYPVGYAISKLDLENNLTNNILAVSTWAFLTIFISWILERKFQPAIRRVWSVSRNIAGGRDNTVKGNALENPLQ